MGSPRTLTLHLDNASRIFYPGQVITGKVAFVNETALKVKGLTVTFYGEAEVYWTESERTSDTVSPYRNGSQRPNPAPRHVHKEYRNHEAFLYSEIVLFGQAEAEGGQDIVIPAGIQSHSFSYQLPLSGLPTSFIGSPFGFVKYTVEARLKRPMFRYDKIEQDFFVNGILDLNFIPRASQPIATSDRVNFGWLCCDEGYATMDLNLERSGYLPGERLNFAASVLNFSNNIIKNIRAAFVQVIDFRTFDRSKRVMNNLKEIVYTHSIVGGGVERWNDSFIIPNVLLPTNLAAGCRIISVTYNVMMEATVSNSSLTLAAPIIIGTDLCPMPVTPPPVVESQATSNNHAKVENTTRVEVHPPLLKTVDDTGEGTGNNDSNVPNQSTPNGYNPALNPFLQEEAEDGLLINLNSETNSTNNNSLENSVIMSEDDGLRN